MLFLALNKIWFGENLTCGSTLLIKYCFIHFAVESYCTKNRWTKSLVLNTLFNIQKKLKPLEFEKILHHCLNNCTSVEWIISKSWHSHHIWEWETTLKDLDTYMWKEAILRATLVTLQHNLIKNCKTILGLILQKSSLSINIVEWMT